MKLDTQRPKPGQVTSAWFDKSGPSLIASGISEKELLILRRRDVDGWELERIGELFGVTYERARQMYWKARRKLSHPRRRKFVCPAYRSLRSNPR